MSFKTTMIESPYAGEVSTHIMYLYRAMQHAIFTDNLAPFASHGIYPYFLNDDKTDERELGIKLGYAYYPRVDYITFYIDYGMSPGMQAALQHIIATNQGDKIRFCSIGKNT